MTDTRPCRVTVTRTSAEDVKQRQIIITLDGEPFDTLLYGETATREIAPGAHRIRANNTLMWKTLEFTADPGGDVRFVTANRAGPGTYALLSMLGVGPLYLTFVMLNVER